MMLRYTFPEIFLNVCFDMQYSIWFFNECIDLYFISCVLYLLLHFFAVCDFIIIHFSWFVKHLLFICIKRRISSARKPQPRRLADICRISELLQKSCRRYEPFLRCFPSDGFNHSATAFPSMHFQLYFVFQAFGFYNLFFLLLFHLLLYFGFIFHFYTLPLYLAFLLWLYTFIAIYCCSCW